jgi:hypothetical protein
LVTINQVLNDEIYEKLNMIHKTIRICLIFTTLIYHSYSCQIHDFQLIFEQERKNPQSRLYSTQSTELPLDVANEIYNYLRPPRYSAPRAPNKPFFVENGIQFKLISIDNRSPGNLIKEDFHSWDNLHLTDMRFTKSHPNIIYHCYYSQGPHSPEHCDIPVIFQAALPSNIEFSSARLILGKDDYAQMLFEKDNEIIKDANFADAIIVVPAGLSTTVEFSYINSFTTALSANMPISQRAVR